MLSIETVKNMPEHEFETFRELVEEFNRHLTKNITKELYYEGKIRLNSVNLGIALPESIGKLKIGCVWGSKTVDVLAARSMFTGFVGTDGVDNEKLESIVEANNLIYEYQKATKDELKYGCTFATLSADSSLAGCKIRFHSPQTASAKWDGSKGRIKCGFAIVDGKENEDTHSFEATELNYYTDNAIFVLKSNGVYWECEEFPHKMGMPLMVALTYNATTIKPFGRSRLKEPVRNLIDGYVRTIANATIGLEFATSPQKYLLGITDEQFDAIVNQKFKQYVGSIIASTTNENGEKPSFGQLPQGNIQPHVEMLRILATQFSAATGLSVTDTGVVNDANPTSSEAILAQTQSLVSMAQELNACNGQSLKNIALMALAIAQNKSIEELKEDEVQIMPHFKNPSMPNVSATADAAIKIASARPEFSGTDVYLEMIGFDGAEIRRIKAQEQRQRGQQILREFEA